MDKINFQKPEFFSAFGIYPSITPLTRYLFFYQEVKELEFII